MLTHWSHIFLTLTHQYVEKAGDNDMQTTCIGLSLYPGSNPHKYFTNSSNAGFHFSKATIVKVIVA